VNPGAGEDEEILVLWEIVQTAHLANRAFSELFASVGLAPTQFGVLACLADGDDFTKTELAHALMVRPQSIDPIVEALIRDGLVRRDGPPRRGRAAGISITPAGLHRHATARPLVSALNDPSTFDLDAQAVRRLAEQLRTIRDKLQR
jgi:DNA-binding MarR family transcriptional regulator